MGKKVKFSRGVMIVPTRTWNFNRMNVVDILATSRILERKLKQEMSRLTSASSMHLATLALCGTRTHGERVAVLEGIKTWQANVYLSARFLGHLDNVLDQKPEVIQILEQICRDEFSDIQ